MKFICLGEKLRVCSNCHNELSLRYNCESGGGDRYYCRKCGTIHLWDGDNLKITEEKMPKCFLEE